MDSNNIEKESVTVGPVATVPTDVLAGLRQRAQRCVLSSFDVVLGISVVEVGDYSTGIIRLQMIDPSLRWEWLDALGTADKLIDPDIPWQMSPLAHQLAYGSQAS